MSIPLDPYYRDRAREILTKYSNHGTDEAPCDSYYCGEQCTYLNVIDDEDAMLLREMAGEEWVKEWTKSITERLNYHR